MEKNKYLENALHKDNCEYLTQFLKDCKENGTAENDSQCPTSWSVYHHPTLEKVLESFLPKICLLYTSPSPRD